MGLRNYGTRQPGIPLGQVPTRMSTFRTPGINPPVPGVLHLNTRNQDRPGRTMVLSSSRLWQCWRLPSVIVAWPHPHQGADDSRKIILVGTAHGDDGGHADEDAVQRDNAQRIEGNPHAVNVRGRSDTARSFYRTELSSLLVRMLSIRYLVVTFTPAHDLGSDGGPSPSSSSPGRPNRARTIAGMSLRRQRNNATRPRIRTTAARAIRPSCSWPTILANEGRATYIPPTQRSAAAARPMSLPAW